MDSTLPSNQPAGDSNTDTGGRFNSSSSSSSSVSYFQKTICLQDWWLIKVDMNGEGERLGVAGFTSREQYALRLFSSAPITKLYSMCTLETMDGICVILNGLINKSHTLENGFSSEVFTHFVMGFPPYWEQYAEGFFRRGSSADVISREDAGKKNLSRGSPETSSKTFGESRHIDSENLNTGAEDCVDMILETGQHGTPFNENKIKQREFKKLEQIFTTDSGLNRKDSRNSKNLVDDVILDGTSIESGPPETSSFNNNSSCTVNKPLLVEPNCTDTEWSENSGNSKRSENDVLSFQNPASVSYDKGNSLNVDGSVLHNFATEVTEKDPLAVLSELERNVDATVENYQTFVDDSATQQQGLSELERNVTSTNINVDANVSKESNERNNMNLRNCQKESDSSGCGATMRKSRSVENDCSGNPEKENRKDKSLDKTVDRIVTRQFSKSKRKQVDQTENVDADLASKSRRRKGSTPKKEKKTGRSTSKLGVSEREVRSKNGVKGTERVVKDTSASGKKTKKKLTYESPIKQGKEEEESIVPIESLSCKRSRSGRLLLPSLEFWRNQTLVYDADGQIAGIKEVPYTVQLSRGSKSEPPKKKSKRLV